MENIYYESLASALHSFISEGKKRFLLTSSGPGEGKSTITANLGRALARSGREGVVLVDSDQIQPTLHKIFRLKNSVGLGEALKDVYQVEIGSSNSKQLGLGDCIELTRVQGRTGRLLVSDDNQEFSILFHKGRISGILWHQRPVDGRLGSMLVKSGRITHEQKEAALRIQEESQEPLGVVLCAMGHVETNDLESILKYQLRECLTQMLALRRPAYRFAEVAATYLPESTSRQPHMGNGHVLYDLIAARLSEYGRQPYLSGQLPGYLKDTEMDNLKVLTSGMTPYDLQDRYIAQQFKALLDSLARKFDVVLIDSPPVGLESPAVSMANLVDGVLLIIKSNGYDLRIIQEAKDQLIKGQASIIGVVLNQVDLKENEYTAYGAYKK